MEGLGTRYRFIPDCINYSDVQVPVNWLPIKWESMRSGLFPETLRLLRQAHQLTQAELARLLGLSKQGYISNLESGRKDPSIELVLRLANLFGVTTDYLLRGDTLDDPVPVNITPNVSAQISPPRFFGAKLRHLRLKHQVSQASLAQQLGLARQGYISNMEIGYREPSLDIVIRVADRFNVPIDYLLRDTIPVSPVDSIEENT